MMLPHANCRGRSKIAAQMGQDRSVDTAVVSYSGWLWAGNSNGGAVVSRCSRVLVDDICSPASILSGLAILTTTFGYRQEMITHLVCLCIIWCSRVLLYVLVSKFLLSSLDSALSTHRQLWSNRKTLHLWLPWRTLSCYNNMSGKTVEGVSQDHLGWY